MQPSGHRVSSGRCGPANGGQTQPGLSCALTSHPAARPQGRGWPVPQPILIHDTVWLLSTPQQLTDGDDHSAIQLAGQDHLSAPRTICSHRVLNSELPDSSRRPFTGASPMWISACWEGELRHLSHLPAEWRRLLKICLMEAEATGERGTRLVISTFPQGPGLSPSSPEDSALEASYRNLLNRCHKRHCHTLRIAPTQSDLFDTEA